MYSNSFASELSGRARCHYQPTCARMTSFVKSRSRPGKSSGTVMVLMPCVVSTCMPATPRFSRACDQTMSLKWRALHRTPCIGLYACLLLTFQY